MTDPGGLERRYRRLLAWYPRTFRREREEEILTVLMAGAQDGQRSLVLGFDLTHVSATTPAFTVIASAAFWLFDLCAVVLVLHHRSRGQRRGTPART